MSDNNSKKTCDEFFFKPNKITRQTKTPISTSNPTSVNKKPSPPTMSTSTSDFFKSVKPASNIKAASPFFEGLFHQPSKKHRHKEPVDKSPQKLNDKNTTETPTDTKSKNKTTLESLDKEIVGKIKQSTSSNTISIDSNAPLDKDFESMTTAESIPTEFTMPESPRGTANKSSSFYTRIAGFPRGPDSASSSLDKYLPHAFPQSTTRPSHSKTVDRLTRGEPTRHPVKYPRYKTVSSAISVNDSEDDTLEAIQTSYKKRLNNKERTITQANSLISDMEKHVALQINKIEKLEHEERNNAKIVEYVLANYTRDKARTDALTEDMEMFKSTFHDLKGLLDLSQKSKAASDQDIHTMLNQCIDEKEKRNTRIKNCKTKIEKISLQHQGFYEKVSATLNSHQQLKNHLDETNTLLNSTKNTLPPEHFVFVNNVVDDVKQKVQTICQDVSKCIAHHEERKLFVTSVVSMVTSTKASNVKILAEAKGLEDEFSTIESLVNSLEDKITNLNKEKEDLKKENEDLKNACVKLEGSITTIKEEKRRELTEYVQKSTTKRMEQQELINKLVIEKSGWNSEKADLLAQIERSSSRRSGSQDGQNSISESSFIFPNRGRPSSEHTAMRPNQRLSNSFTGISEKSIDILSSDEDFNVSKIEPIVIGSSEKVSNSEDDDPSFVNGKQPKRAGRGKRKSSVDSNASTSGRYKTRSRLAAASTSEEQPASEGATEKVNVEVSPKRRKLRKLPPIVIRANEGDSDDDGPGNMSKAISRAMDSVLSSEAEQQHISTSNKEN